MDEAVHFSIPYFQVLDNDGNAKQDPEVDKETIKKAYELMVLSRIFDETAMKLQREGRMYTYAPLKGEEATQIGSALALKDEDWIFPSYRENGSLIARGMPIDLLYLYWMGDERGMHIPESVNNFPICIPVSTQIPHAVGFAWAAKMKKQKSVTMVYFGDGGTSRGDMHEGMNFAGVFKLPVVFLCRNNQWAISMPRSHQTAAETLAQKAIAYGFEGIQVDGNDFFAVYLATKEAVEKARKGRPVMIECVTYRMADHTTADDAKKYRTEEELAQWAEKDPIERLRKYMKGQGIWSESYQKKVIEDCQEKIEEAVKKAESVPPQTRDDVFKHMYATMPWFLKEQMNED